MGFEESPRILLTCPRNETGEFFLEDFESEEQVENFILQPARESCRKMFSVGLSSYTGNMAIGKSVKTLTDGIFLKSTFQQRNSGRDEREHLTNSYDERVESEAQSDSDEDCPLSSVDAGNSSSSSESSGSSSSTETSDFSSSLDTSDSSHSHDTRNPLSSPNNEGASSSPDTGETANSLGTRETSSSPDIMKSSRCLEVIDSPRCPGIKNSSQSPDAENPSCSPDPRDSSISPDALRKMVRSILSSAVKCETDDQNNNLLITSHWCEICLVYDPNGANKHMEYHIIPAKLFLKRVLGYEELMHNYGSHSPSQQLPLCILETCAINLVHFNCVFEKGLMLMPNNIIYKQKRWLNLLLLEVLDFTSSIRKFKISDIRNLPSFGDDGGFMKTRLLSTEEGDSTLFSYLNAVAEFVKLLQYITNKSFYSFNVLLESKLTEQEVEVSNFLKRTEKLSNILTIFIKGWRESLKPKREIEIQATEMLSMDLWLQMLDNVVGLDLGILLTSFGSYMASYHGGNISKAGIQAILLLTSDMLNTLLPDLEHTVEFKFEYLQYLHVAFFPGGWLDLALRQPCFNYNNSVCLPILSVNKFLMFLEVFNWYGEYSLNLDSIYKTIHGLCFPTYNFDVFKLQRL